MSPIIWIPALVVCAAAFLVISAVLISREPKPRNRRTHRLARWMRINGTLH